MLYTFIVTSNHLTTGRSALETVRNIIVGNNQINCIYFLFDGVYTANKYIDMPTDEFALTNAWADFAQEFNIPLLVCAASGLRRGIVEQTIADGFAFGSIGQLVEYCDRANEVITL